MTTITVAVTPDLVALLGDLSERIEFRDMTGRLVGEYNPAQMYDRYVNPIDGSPFTEEEVRRMADEPIENLKGRPLAEILKDLETRA